METVDLTSFTLESLRNWATLAVFVGVLTEIIKRKFTLKATVLDIIKLGMSIVLSIVGWAVMEGIFSNPSLEIWFGCLVNALMAYMVSTGGYETIKNLMKKKE